MTKCPEFNNWCFKLPSKKENQYFVKISSKNEEEPAEPVFLQFGTNLNFKNGEETIELDLPDENQQKIVIAVDDYVIKTCKENKEKWFNSQDITDSNVDDAFYPSLSRKHSIKLRKSKDLIYFNSLKEKISENELDEKSKISVAVMVEGVWFSKTRFGVTWKVIQLLHHDKKPIEKIGKCLFDNLEEDLDNVFPEL
tara:strand:+ start:633 stop:1220 length:588 start_codon:yes stop_codon:yes gene_type:complete